MKKILAIILALTFVLSLTACGKASKTAVSGEKNISKPKAESGATQKDKSDDFSLNEITSFDDFVQKIDDSDLKPTITENDDGSITVELNDKTKDDQISKPTIPTIDKITKPETPKQEEDTSDKNSKDDKPEKENKDETTDVPQPEPEVEPQPEPEEEPEVAPQPEPEPEPEVKPETKPETPKVEEEKKPQYTYTTNQKHTMLPNTQRYLYSLLDNEKKAWYKAIDNAVINLDARTIRLKGIADDRNYYIYFLYMFDNPEHFYLGASITINSYGEGMGALTFSYSDGEMSCRFGGELKEINDELRNRIRAKQKVFQTEVNRIISTIPANAPDVWKEKLIYDRILIDSYYNLGAQWDGIAEDNWTAYGILVNKHGVCESYAEAFQTLCLYVGINCTGVVGTAGGGHKWNCVQLDGEWYMCDITFDDPIGGEQGAAYHYYFNLTSAKMMELCHDWSDSQWPVPNCTAAKYSYNNYFGN